MPETQGLDEQDRVRRIKQVENALANGRLAGLEPSEEAAAIFKRYVDGELSLDQMGRAIEAYTDREYGKNIGKNLDAVRFVTQRYRESNGETVILFECGHSQRFPSPPEDEIEGVCQQCNASASAVTQSSLFGEERIAKKKEEYPD